jgi:hypothetical protein
VQSTQNRLENDLRAVQNDKMRLQALMDGLSNVNSESERTRADEKIKLEKRVDELQKEMSVFPCRYPDLADSAGCHCASNLSRPSKRPLLPK